MAIRRGTCLGPLYIVSLNSSANPEAGIVLHLTWSARQELDPNLDRRESS
jgi:hypothetical protein